MTKTAQVRKLLRDTPDGLTVRQLADELGTDAANTRRLIKDMPDVYVDRWSGPRRGQYEAVYCAVIPPPDCPHPKETK